MAQPTLARNFVDGLTKLDGRMTRSDFWVISIALSIAAILLGISLTSLLRMVTGGAVPRWILPVLLQLIIVWPAFAVSVKRGHDRERSAMWTLGVNVALHIIPTALVIAGKGQGAFYVWAVIGLYVLIDYGFLDGTQGPNKYGASPKGIGTAGNTADFEG